MEKRAKRAKTKAEEMTLEEAFVRLDGMIARLEMQGIPLEESFQIYKEGMKLLKKCNDKIDTVEKKMLQVNKSGEFSGF
ncbi:MAG: exodeoxyribonuclease VII small subunit [Lachnospiraceae bacterium]|nr:exodeoxyribonuclease VII small subunit [Lachnospiraceae bacterium]